eukprot:gene10544-3063_t
MSKKNTLEFLLNNKEAPELCSGPLPSEMTDTMTPNSAPGGTKQNSKIRTTNPKKQKRPYNLYIDLHSYDNSSHKKKQKTEIPKPNSGKWSVEEIQNFERGFKEIGRRWTDISKLYVKTRNPLQVTSYSQKFLRELEDAK